MDIGRLTPQTGLFGQDKPLKRCHFGMTGSRVGGAGNGALTQPDQRLPFLPLAALCWKCTNRRPKFLESLSMRW